MRRTSLAALILATLAIPAGATENITCSAPGNAASITFLAGTTPGLNPLSLSMEAGGKRWSTTAEQGATTVLVGQSFSDDAAMMIDVTDGNAERVIAELRVARAHEDGHDPVAAGTFRIAGTGAWTVTCEGE